MPRFLLSLAALASSAWAIDAPADVAREISHLRLDPAECYRIPDLDLARGPLSVHLGPGWLIFAEPVQGVRPGAVYLPGSGESRIAIAPTAIAERLALARAVHKTALDEPFGKSLLLFTDGTDTALRATLDRRHAPRDARTGADLAREWAAIFAHIADSFHTRLVRDLLSRDPSRGVFYIGAATRTVGDIDIFYDPSASEQTVIGRRKDGRFEILAACCDIAPRAPAAIIRSYRLDTTIQPDLRVAVIAQAAVAIQRAAPVLVFSLSRVMTVQRAEVDGVPAPVFQSQSLYSNLLRDRGTAEFFLVAPAALEAGSVHQVRIQYSGETIEKMSNGELLVGAREDWYPRTSDAPATYDLTFRSSSDLTLVASGTRTSQYLNGDSIVSQWRMAEPAYYATFNLGRFERLDTSRDHVATEIYYPDAAPEAGARRIADQALDMIGFMTASLGPALAGPLLISPIPSPLGQNLSGSVFLPGSLFKEFSSDKLAAAQGWDERLRRRIGVPHEIAHQWWGNAVRYAGYHDEWITEALANYSALLYAERTEGKSFTAEVVDHYRQALSRNLPDGSKVSDAGSITLGYRLLAEHGPAVWRTLTYGKGTLILHALRAQMGDDAFEQFLRALFTEYQTQPLTTAALERSAARFLPPGTAKPFFDSCVNGLALP